MLTFALSRTYLEERAAALAYTGIDVTSREYALKKVRPTPAHLHAFSTLTSPLPPSPPPSM